MFLGCLMMEGAKMSEKHKAKKLILIVEDEIQYAFLLQQRLKKAGFDVEIAENGSKAFSLMKTGIPDLIVLDLIMPRMDGRAFLDKMRKDDKYKDIKVLILSNLGDEIKSAMIEKWGIEDFIVKTDISLDKMVSRIKKACE